MTYKFARTLPLLILFFLSFSVADAQGLPTGGDSVTELPEMVVEADRYPETPSESDTLQEVVAKLIVRGSNAAVVLLIGATVLVFMYGMMKYMFKGSGSDTARAEGRKLMLWGIIGLFVMVSVWGLVGILSNTIGHTSTALPQFEDESLAAPNGRRSDGTPITTEERVASRRYFENIRNNGNRILDNARQNLDSARERFQNMIDRIRGRQSTPEE